MRYIVDSVIKNCLGLERSISVATTRFRNYELKTTNYCSFCLCKFDYFMRKKSRISFRNHPFTIHRTPPFWPSI